MYSISGARYSNIVSSHDIMLRDTIGYAELCISILCKILPIYTYILENTTELGEQRRPHMVLCNVKMFQLFANLT